MFIHVIFAQYIRDYVVRIGFSNGVVKEVDLSSELYGEVFEPLRDDKVFKHFRVDEETRTISWPNGADFAPEYLYEIGKEIEPSTLRETA
jgi:hypothetical protein